MRVRASLLSVAVLVTAAAIAASAAGPGYSHFTINVAQAKVNTRIFSQRIASFCYRSGAIATLGKHVTRRVITLGRNVRIIFVQ
jgi:hypothetical protein